MYPLAAASQSSNPLIWIVVVVATLTVVLVSIVYTSLLLGQSAKVRRGDSVLEIQQRFGTHRPFSLPVNTLVIGVSGTAICFLLEHMNPILPVALSFWLCLVPLGTSILCALPVLLAILGLKSALR